MARPTKLNKELIGKVITRMADGANMEAAVEASGVHRATAYTWKARGELEASGIYREFSDAIKKARAMAEIDHVSNITKIARDGTWQASAWWLERSNPKQWGQQVKLTVETERHAFLVYLGSRLQPELYKRVLEAAMEWDGSESVGSTQLQLPEYVER